MFGVLWIAGKRKKYPDFVRKEENCWHAEEMVRYQPMSLRRISIGLMLRDSFGREILLRYG